MNDYGIRHILETFVSSCFCSNCYLLNNLKTLIEMFLHPPLFPRHTSDQILTAKHKPESHLRKVGVVRQERDG